MKWQVDFTYIPDRYRIVDENLNLIASTPYGDHASTIVRDHNRAEAFEAMREALEYARGRLRLFGNNEHCIKQIEAALALAKGEPVATR